MKKKRTILLVALLGLCAGLLVSSVWIYFYAKGFSVRNAPRALAAIMTYDHEMLDKLVDQRIVIGGDSSNFPTAASVWNYGAYSEYKYELAGGPDEPDVPQVCVIIITRQGKNITARAVGDQWEVTFFESDEAGRSRAWNTKYNPRALEKTDPPSRIG